MDINSALNALLKKALESDELRQRLLATRHDTDPLDSFCHIACENDCPVTVGEMFTLNQTLCDNLLKSTNGGATYPIDDWADAYEMFISSLL